MYTAPIYTYASVFFFVIHSTNLAHKEVIGCKLAQQTPTALCELLQ